MLGPVFRVRITPRFLAETLDAENEDGAAMEPDDKTEPDVEPDKDVEPEFNNDEDYSEAIPDQGSKAEQPVFPFCSHFLKRIRKLPVFDKLEIFEF